VSSFVTRLLLVGVTAALGRLASPRSAIIPLCLGRAASRVDAGGPTHLFLVIQRHAKFISATFYGGGARRIANFISLMPEKICKSIAYDGAYALISLYEQIPVAKTLVYKTRSTKTKQSIKYEHKSACTVTLYEDSYLSSQTDLKTFTICSADKSGNIHGYAAQ